MACLAVCLASSAQVIDFESNGLHYKTLTKSGVTVMFTYFHSHIKEYLVMQVSVSNGERRRRSKSKTILSQVQSDVANDRP